MNSDVIITCAITGDDTKVTKSPHCPITPGADRRLGLEAARAGAAIVHIHVRDPETGAFSMATRHYREVVKRIRESRVDVLVNLTCGMGGYICVGDQGLKDTPAPGTRLRQPGRAHAPRHRAVPGRALPPRHRHARLRHASTSATATAPTSRRPNYLRQGAGILRDLGVKAELEVFDTGNLWFVRQLIKEGLIPAPALIQLCTGIPYGVPADTGHLLAMVNTLPADCVWTSFAISRMQMPWVAQSILLGGNVRVGLEDNLYLSRGVYASNAQLVEKARTIIEAMGARIVSPGAGPRAAAAALSVARPMAAASIDTAIAPEWIDYNGHLRDAYYGLIVSYAIDALMDRIGLDAAYRGAHRLHALHAGDAHALPARGEADRPASSVTVRILGADHKRIHAAFELAARRAAQSRGRPPRSCCCTCVSRPTARAPRRSRRRSRRRSPQLQARDRGACPPRAPARGAWSCAPAAHDARRP